MAIPFAFPSDDETEANIQILDQLFSDLIGVLHQIIVTQRRIRNAQQVSRNRIVQANAARRTDDTITQQQHHNPQQHQQQQQLHQLALQSAPGPSRLFIPHAQFATNLARSVTLESFAPQSVAQPGPAAQQGVAMQVEAGAGAVAATGSPSRRRRRRRRGNSESSSCCCEEAKARSQSSNQEWTQVGVNLRHIADDFHDSVGKNNEQVEEVKRPYKAQPSSNEAGLLSMLVPPPFSSSIWTAVIFVVGWRLLARTR